MAEAKRFLGQHKVWYSEPNPGHLKIGRSINYWPASGKVFIDATSGSRVDRGLPALEAVLRERGYLQGPAAPKATPRRSKPITPALFGQADLQMPSAEAFTLAPTLTVEVSDTPKDHNHD